MPNVVSVAASITELDHGEKLHTQSLTHPAYLIPGISFFSYDELKNPKVGQVDLVLVSDQGSLVGACTLSYKSVFAAVAICSTLANIQTHTDNTLPAYLTSSAS